MQSLFHWITDLLFPPRCARCNAVGSFLCAPCTKTLKPKNGQHGWVIAAATMDNAIESLIYALKYKNIFGLAEPLGDWMASALGLNSATQTMFGNNPILVPVPLHPKRLRERGYNQAALLAKRIAIASAMPLCDTALARVRATHSQVETSSRDERLANMQFAFCATKPELITGKDIVLVDDVSTTGATLEDCARALRVAGARSVHAIVLARK